MTQSNEPMHSLFELQKATMTEYLTLLNDINTLGVEGFGALIDTASEQDLRVLHQAAQVVRNQITRFRSTPQG